MLHLLAYKYINMTMFDLFILDGIYYFKEKNKFYADNGTIKEEITLKEYRWHMTEYLIHSCVSK